MRSKIPAANLASIGRIPWTRQAGRGTAPHSSMAVYGYDGSGTASSITPDNAGVAPGGVIVANFRPMVGIARPGETTAIQNAAQRMFAEWRSKNMSISAYVAADTFKYAYSMEQLSLLFGYAFKMINIEGRFSKMNWNYGRTLMAAHGYTPSADLANEILTYNRLVNRFNTLAVPANIPMFEDQFDLVTNVYADDQTKPQFFAFKPVCVGIWDRDPLSATVGEILFPIFTTELASLANILAKIDSILSSYLSDQDIANMSSEVLKAYGSSLFQLKNIPTDPNWNWEATFDQDLVDQLHNSITVPAPANSWSVYENSGTLVAGHSSTSYGGILNGELAVHGILEGNSSIMAMTSNVVQALVYNDKDEIPFFSHYDNPSAEQNVILSRFRPIIHKGTLSSANARCMHIASCGTEIIHSFTLAFQTRGGIVATTTFYSFVTRTGALSGYAEKYLTDLTLAPAVTITGYDVLDVIYTFAAAPCVYWINATSSYNGSYLYISWSDWGPLQMGFTCRDLDNFCYFSRDSLTSIHTEVIEAALG